MRRLALAALAALAAAVCASAQTLPCEARNDTTTTTSGAITAAGFTGPGTLAWQFTPSAPIAVQSAQLFTGNALATPGFMTLELWSDDPATGLPAARLAGGTWRIWPTLASAWQGTNLDAVTVLLPATQYWLVWIEPGFSLIPTEPGGTFGPTARRSGTTWTLQATQHSPKFRLFCNPLDALGLVPAGAPCAQTSGALGTLFANQPPRVGNADFAVEGTGFAAGVPALLVLGVDPTFASTPVTGLPFGCLQHTDVLATVFGATGTGNQRANAITVGAAGHVTFALPIPANPAFAGFFLGSQLAVLDAGAPAFLPFATSNALRVTVF